MQPALNLDKSVEIVNLVNQTLLYLSSGQTCLAFSVWSICMSTCIHLIAAMNGICQAQPQRLSSMSCNTPQTFKGIKQVGIIATFPWTKLGKLRMTEFLVHRGRVTALFNCKVEAKHTLADSTCSHTELHSNELPKTRDFCGPVWTTVIGGTRQPVSEYIQHSHLFPSCVYIIHIMVTSFKLLDNSFTICPACGFTMNYNDLPGKLQYCAKEPITSPSIHLKQDLSSTIVPNLCCTDSAIPSPNSQKICVRQVWLE